MKIKLSLLAMILVLCLLTGCCFSGWPLVTSDTTVSGTISPDISAHGTDATETTAKESTSDSSAETTSKETTSDSSAETTAPDATATDATSPETTAAAETTAPETASQKVAPTIELRIYEGPTFSAADGVCSYKLEAVVTGNPNPIVAFSKDNSNGAWGSKKVQINLHAGESYNITATATNSEGKATASKNLTYGCAQAQNKVPDVGEIIISKQNLSPETDTAYAVSVVASDPDGDILAYKWSVSAGTLANSIINPANWKTPVAAGECTISLSVTDGKGHTVNKTKKVQVLQAPPAIFIMGIGTLADKVFLDAQNILMAELNDNSQAANVIWSWRVSSGTTTRTDSPILTWRPDREGENEVTVEIRNEKGELLSSKTQTFMVIRIITVDLNLNKIESEGGFIEQGGAVFAGGNLYAGDSNNNKRCTGLVSFDITGLAGVVIKSVETSFLISQGWGNPLGFAQYLSLTSYYWGPRPIRNGDDIASGDVLQTFEPATFACFNEELRGALQNAIDEGRTRFQMRIHFAGGPSTNNNNSWDGWEYPQSNIKLHVVYLKEA
jgi:hypothetical protein